MLKRAGPLVAVAAIAGAAGACDALIGLGDPSVRAGGADAAGDGRTSADADTDAVDLDGGDTGPRWPTACPAMGACGPGLACAPQFHLCEPSCSPVAPCPSPSLCIQLDAGSALGACEGADYGCVGTVTYPSQTGPTVDVTVSFVNMGPQVVSAITVRACDTSDPVCAHPLAMGTTDTSGTVTLSLPNAGDGFRGYFDLTGPAMGEELQYWSGPLTTGNVAVQVGLDTYWQFVFQATDPSRGRLWITAEGCSSTPAFGATLSVSGTDSETEIGMLDNLSVDRDANAFPIATPSFPIEPPGLWAFAVGNDLPVGTATLTTTHSGARVGTMQVGIRAGVITLAVLAPTP